MFLFEKLLHRETIWSNSETTKILLKSVLVQSSSWVSEVRARDLLNLGEKSILTIKIGKI